MRRDTTKDHTRNRLMDSYLRGASTYSKIIKIEHFESHTPSGSTDLQPFVVYSLNKKKRWEYPQNVDNSDEDDVKVFVFEREAKNLSDAWWCLKSDNYDNSYNLSTAIDAKLMENAKQEDKVIAYHVIRIPKNYKTLFDKKCIRNWGLRYPDFLGNCVSGHLKRWDNTVILDSESGEWEEEEVSEKKEAVNVPTQSNGFYNLEDHIVVKKTRRHKTKGWTFV